MKIIIPLVALVIVGLSILGFAGDEEYKTLEIGQKAPLTDLKMNSTNGEKSNLEELKKTNGTLVIFSCNTCPFVIAWEGRYPEIASLSNKADIGFALVNSNEAKRQGDDSLEEMMKHAKEKGYADIPYLADNNSTLANAFGAKTTPHVFLFDKNWKLVYEGAIDDNHKNADEVNRHYLINAIENLKDNKAIDPNNTKALGCSIKRVKI